MGLRAAIVSSTLLVALSLAATAAQAAPTTVARFVPSQSEHPYLSEFFAYSGPALAGSSVAWARTLPSGGWVVERGSPGRVPVRLARSPRPDATTHALSLIGASRSRVAWSDYGYDVINAKAGDRRTVRSQLHVSGLVPGSVEPLAGCGGAMPPCECPTYCGYGDSYAFGDVAGDTVAYLSGHYRDPTIVIDDLASPAPPVRIRPGTLVDVVRLAGDLAAWGEHELSSGRVRTVVYDWRARREVYAIDAGGLQGLQADGKIVRSDLASNLVWHAPDDRAPHAIERERGHHLGSAAIARDRILFRDTAEGSGTRLVLSDLGGNRTELAAEGGANSRELGFHDFDGRRASWSERECGLVAMMVEPDVRGDAVARPPAPRCVPPRITDLRRAAGGRFVARMICERGCRGTLGLYDLSSHPRTRLASRPLELRASKAPRDVTLTPSAAMRRELTKRPAARVQAVFSGRDGRGHRVGAATAGSLKRP